MVLEGAIRGGALRWSSAREEDKATVALSGEIDLTVSDALEDVLITSFQGASRAVLDLSRLRFLDASGVRLLLRLNEQFGPRLRLRDPSPIVMRVFDAAGVKNAFTIE
jgi:anti-anti-sigma factor